MPTPTFPTSLSLASVEFYLQGNTRVYTSPFTNTVQVLEMGGARWVATITLDDMLANSDEHTQLEAMLNGLMGASGVFWLNVPVRRAPRGSALGTPLAAGAAAAGAKTLATDGWTVSQAGALLPGDFFGLGDRLYQITAQADADGSGAATLEFVPPLRAAVADNAPLTLTSPRSPFRLADDAGGRWSQAGVIASRVMTAVEALEFAG